MSRKPARNGHAARRRRRAKASRVTSSAVERLAPAASALSWRQRLRTIFLCGMIELAVLSGAPMRPEEIRELMQTMNQPRIVHVLPDENESGDAHEN